MAQQNWGDDFIRAFMAGRQMRQEEEEMAARQKDREQRRKLQEYDIKRQKIQDQLSMQEFKQKQSAMAAQMLQGQPGTPVSAPGQSMQLPPQSAPEGAPSGIADIINAAKARGVGGMEVAGPDMQGELRHAPVQIPGMNIPEEQTPFGPVGGYESPGFQVRPQTENELMERAEQMRRAQIMEAAQKAMLVSQAEVPGKIAVEEAKGRVASTKQTEQNKFVAGENALKRKNRLQVAGMRGESGGKYGLQEELAALNTKTKLTPDEQRRKEAIEVAMTIVARTYGPGYRELATANGQTMWMHPSTGQVVMAPAGTRPQFTAGEREKISDIDEMLTQAKMLRSLGDKNRSSIGRVQGTIASLKRSWVGASPEVNDLFLISDNMADKLLRARSGAQINENEFARLRPLVPDPRLPESKFFSDLDMFEGELKRIIARRSGQAPLVTPGNTPAGGNTAVPTVGGTFNGEKVLKVERVN